MTCQWRELDFKMDRADREKRGRIMQLLWSRRCTSGGNSREQADPQNRPSASPSDTDRETETSPTARHSARLSGDSFSVRLSCEILPCEGLCVPRQNEE